MEHGVTVDEKSNMSRENSNAGFSQRTGAGADVAVSVKAQHPRCERIGMQKI
ncbi:MAG TPA: hypothetical protein VHD87_15100 [Acidimicrobiales bacterium]|nr:hypothetical protein [Acidimicrobiales bacterium]